MSCRQAFKNTKIVVFRADIAQLTDDLELAQKKKCMLLAQRNKLRFLYNKYLVKVLKQL